ncbi:ferredoxin [bacterium]|nr:ferredoxin [bacterium]
MAIVRVWVEEGCTECGVCEETCPEVFRLGDDGVEVIEGADLAGKEESIKEAKEECPIEIIMFEEE